MTLQQKRVWPITLLFKVRLYNYFTECHYIGMTCPVQRFGRYLEGQGHSMTLHSNRVRLITALFEVLF